MRKAVCIWVVVLLAGGCAPSVSQFNGGAGAPDQRTRDYAACENQAESMRRGGGLMDGLAYNKALKNCMIAKGYAVSD